MKMADLIGSIALSAVEFVSQMTGLKPPAVLVLVQLPDRSIAIGSAVSVAAARDGVAEELAETARQWADEMAQQTPPAAPGERN